MISKHL